MDQNRKTYTWKVSREGGGDSSEMAYDIARVNSYVTYSVPYRLRTYIYLKILITVDVKFTLVRSRENASHLHCLNKITKTCVLWWILGISWIGLFVEMEKKMIDD